MIENFTSAYRIVDLEFQEYSSPFPVIRDDLHNTLRQDYNEDVPLVMKHENVHFPVAAENAVPADTILIPSEMTDWFDVDCGLQTADSETLFSLKGDHAQSMLSLIPNV